LKLIWLRLLICGGLIWLSNMVVFGQMSPKGTFKIESEPKAAPPGTEGSDIADFVVSTSDPKLREPLGEHADTTHLYYVISPDEKWIYVQISYGHRMIGGELYHRSEGLKFERVNKSQSFAERVWRFFAKEERLKADNVPYLQLFDGQPSEEGIIDFVAWSPDSARVLVDLRQGDFGGERSRGYLRMVSLLQYQNASSRSY
jgi:hypothetical protein